MARPKNSLFHFWGTSKDWEVCPLKDQNFTVLCSLVLLKNWVGQNVNLVLNTNKTHFSFSPRTVLNNIFTNQMNFLANQKAANTLLLP